MFSQNCICSRSWFFLYDLTHQFHEGAKDLTVPTKAPEQKFANVKLVFKSQDTTRVTE